MVLKYFFFLFLFSFVITQGRIDGVVAIVGDNIILHSDVLQQSQLVALNRRVDPVKMPHLFTIPAKACIKKFTLTEMIDPSQSILFL